jgi:hypothetical protein
MNKYSLVRLMENEDEFQSSNRLTIKNNLMLEPITKTAEQFLEIINDPKNTKGVFVKINPELYNSYFGPSVPPTTKQKLERERVAIGLDPFAPKTPAAIENFKTKSKNLGAQIQGKNIIFVPNEITTIKSIKGDLGKILKNAKLEKGTDYTLSEKES